MSERKIKEIVRFAKLFLKKRHVKVDKVILFGSYARREFHKDSDVDIAIVSTAFEGKDIFQRIRMTRGLNWALVRRFILPFDIVTMSLKEWKESSSLIASFVRQGKEIVA